jgi:hypothetical protein
MPWLPEFTSAAELARKELRAAGQADPVAQYLGALSDGTSRTLETAWPGQIVIDDPRAGRVHGHRGLRKFIRQNKAWFSDHDARVEIVASTRVRGRAAVEVIAHLRTEGQEVAWPVAIVAESDDNLSVVFRTYCSQQPVDGRRHVRDPILAAGADLPGDAVGRYFAALEAGDADAVAGAFTADGCYREAIGTHRTHCGAAQLRSFFNDCFSAGGGISLTPCVVTDDGVRCAVEYNCVRWGSDGLPPQAGLAVHDRSGDGLLAAVRTYDDIEAPLHRRASSGHTLDS